MHDLRKKILLESGKTMSKKARSRPESSRGSASHSPVASPGQSRPGSRANSRPPSRYTSEFESSSGDEFDDSMTISTNSISDDGAVDESGAQTWPWKDRLQSRIIQLEDRKGSSAQGRIDALTGYLHILRHYYALTQIDTSLSDIVTALMKSIRSGGNSAESSLALKALSITILTCPSESVFGTTYSTLKVVCEDTEDEDVKANALYAMSTVVLYGGGATEAAEDFLDFLVEIIESDGQAVAAGDSGIVVSAALQNWAFVASHLDDLSNHCEQAMEAFVEQLDSTDAGVSTCAGSNIALLFEAAREHEEETGETLNLPFDPKRLIARMTELARGSKSISKRDRRHVRQNFSSIVTSLELGKGPGYSTSGRPASNPNTGGSKIENDTHMQEFGYRDKIRVGENIITIDTWSLSARVGVLRVLLGGGFPFHFIENPIITEILNEADIEKIMGPVRPNKESSPRKKGRKSR